MLLRRISYLLFLFAASLIPNLSSAQYCIPPAPVTHNASFAKVSFMGNSYSYKCPTNTYNLAATSSQLFAGQTFLFTTELTNCFTQGDSIAIVTAYADWNSDLDFDDPGEIIFNYTNIKFNSKFIDSITIPSSVTPGTQSRIRIRVSDENLTDPILPCSNQAQTIDYPISFIAPPAQPAKPTPFIVYNVKSRSAQLVWQDNGFGESGYTIERAVDNGAFIPFANLPPNSVRINDSTLVPGKNYKYKVNATGNHPDSSVTETINSLAVDFLWSKQVFPFSGSSTGVYWNDFDKNGTKDLFLSFSFTQFSTYPAIFSKQNNVFSLLIDQEFTSNSGGAWIDFDNDGDNDFYATSELFSGGSIQCVMYENNGDGTFTPFLPFVPDGQVFSAAWSDYNNDGLLDVYLNYQVGSTGKLYRNNGNKTFSFVRSFSPVNGAVSFVDYDNDGDEDLVFAGFNTAVFQKQDSTFTAIPKSILNFYSGQQRGTSWGDFDNNGMIDLFIPMDAHANSVVFMNQGNGQFSKSSLFGNDTIPGNTYGSAIGDLDNDGYLDVFASRNRETSLILRNNQLGELRIMPREVFINEEDAISPFGKFGGMGVAFADYNNDGFLDIFQSIRNITLPVSANRLYTNQTNSNNWIHINLIGTASNKNAIGAKISLKANGKWQYRWIESNTGMAAQNDYTVEFGLGVATTIDSLIIKWPLGDIQIAQAPSINQVITVNEPPLTNATWLGTIDSSWHNPLNWSTGIIPDALTNVIITSGTPNNCIISSPAICRTLKLNSGSVLTNNSMLDIKK